MISPTATDGIQPRAPLHILPPCRVCGMKASGLHYGVNTCEACKGFFRRSMFNKDKYSCSKSMKCEITPGKRNHCAYCRYKKCIQLGMSVNAIRTGRYTHQKKANDIIEVKTIEGNLKSSITEESTKLLIQTILNGVKDTEIIPILSTHYSQLELADSAEVFQVLPTGEREDDWTKPVLNAYESRTCSMDPVLI